MHSLPLRFPLSYTTYCTPVTSGPSASPGQMTRRQRYRLPPLHAMSSLTQQTHTIPPGPSSSLVRMTRRQRCGTTRPRPACRHWRATPTTSGVGARRGHSTAAFGCCACSIVAHAPLCNTFWMQLCRVPPAAAHHPDRLRGRRRWLVPRTNTHKYTQFAHTLTSAAVSRSTRSCPSS